MANVTVTLTGDEARLLRSLQKIIDKEGQLGQKAAETGRKAKEAGDKAFGPQALQQIASYAAGFMSVSAAVGLVTNALKEMDRTRKEAVERMKGAEGGLSRLAQLATSPEEFEKFVSIAKEIRQRRGAGTLGEAADLTFQLASGSALEERGFFAKLYQIANPAEVAGAAASLRAAFGAKETGSLQALVSKSIAAAAPAPRVGVTDILMGMTKAAPGAGLLGISDEETFAAMSILAKKLGSADVAGTRLAAFFKAATKRGIPAEGGIAGMVSEVRSYLEKGRPMEDKTMLEALVSERPKEERRKIMERISKYRRLGYNESEILEEMAAGGYAPEVEELRARRVPMSKAELLQFFGRKQAYEAFAMLSKPAIEEMKQKITAAEREDLASRMVRFPETVPELAARRAAEEAKAEREMAPGMARRQITEDFINRVLAVKRRQFEEAGGPAEVVGNIQQAFLRFRTWLPGFREALIYNWKTLQYPEIGREYEAQLADAAQKLKDAGDKLGDTPAAKTLAHPDSELHAGGNFSQGEH